MNREILLIVPKKLSPFTKVLLLFNQSTSKNPIFVFIVIIPKYFALLSLVSNFSIEYDNKFKENYFISNQIRKATVFNVGNSITPIAFYIISVILFLFQIILSFTLIYLYYCSSKNTKHLKIGFLTKLIFYLQTIFSQYILEFYSFSLLFMFRNSFNLPTEEFFSKYSNLTILTKEEDYNTITIYFFGIINFISYFTLNIFIVFSGFIINSPFQTQRTSITFLHDSYNAFLCITANIYSIHYYGYILPGRKRIIFKSVTFGLFFLLCLTDAFQNMNKFEKATFAYLIMKYLNYYCLSSIILEVIIGVLKIPLSLTEVFVITCLKLFLSLLMFTFYRYYKLHSLLKLLGNILFNHYEASHLEKFIEGYHFLIDFLIMNKSNNIGLLTSITDIVRNHRNICDNENCKCKLIKLFPNKTLTDNNDFIEYIYSSLGFYIETTFVNIPSYSNIKVSILLAEYYFFIKNILFYQYPSFNQRL